MEAIFFLMVYNANKKIKKKLKGSYDAINITFEKSLSISK
jgi:hypothetical protein